MIMASKLMGVMVTAAGLMVAAQAPAEPAAPVRVVPSGDYSYSFDDDPLSGSGLGDMSWVLRVRAPGIRTMLLRPRTTLVPEILKSVEGI
jgi:hypothetical protein